jgi:hypothetical protein
MNQIPGNTRDHAADGNLSKYDPIALPDPVTSAVVATPLPPLPPRQRLKEACAALATANADVLKAQELSDKAGRLFEAAKADFSRSQVASHEVLQWKIDAFKKGSLDPIPADLREAREENIFASENLEHAEIVSNTMLQELQIAQSKLREAKRTKAEAINAVVVDRAKDLTNELVEISRKRNCLRILLQNLAVNFTLASESGRIVSGLVHSGMSDLTVNAPTSEVARYWKEFSMALESNADALPGNFPVW